MSSLVRKTDRFLLLDVMRAIAVFMMVEGHSFDALMSPVFLDRSNPFWFGWEFVRGLTAPIFLFGSGFAYVLATVSKSDNGRLPRSVYLKRLRWILVLFATGAIMHLPGPTLDAMSRLSAAEWSRFFQVDVLRLMAVSLLLLLAVFASTRSVKQILATSLTVGTLIVLSTPLIYDVQWTKFLPESLAAYMSVETGSYFPIFPFAGYLFAGAASGALYLVWKRSGKEAKLPAYFGMIGLVFIVGATLLDMLPVKIYPAYNYWKTSPNFFLVRTGLVLLLWTTVGYSLRLFRTIPAVIPRIGQHTLAIYVGHVVLLYGCAWMGGLTYFFGGALHPAQVLGVIGMLYLASVGYAMGIDHVKKNTRWIYRGLQFALPVAIVLLTFQ